MIFNDSRELPKTFKDRKVCVMGLGFVGLTLAVTLADIGFEVYGVELRKDIVKKLRKGEPHFFEPGLEGRLKSQIKSKKLKIFQKIKKDFDVSIYIITVGTPIKKNNLVNKEMMERVCKEISLFTKNDDLIILRSTVEVGTTKKMTKNYFKKKKFKVDVAFCPERTIEGNAMIELRKLPQIVGADEMEVTSRVSQFFSFMTPTVVKVSNSETAELIKLIDNCQRDVSFALSNEIAEIADKYSVSAYEVINSGKLGYPRTNLPNPGPVGGPCLEKDSYILKNGLNSLNYFPKIIMNSRQVNAEQPENSISLLRKLCEKKMRGKSNYQITISGIAFKGRPETNDLRGTMALPIINEIKKKFPQCNIKIYDPIVKKNEAQKFFKNLDFSFTNFLQDSFKNCSLYIICNNHPIFSTMPITILSQKMKNPSIIFDYWNNFTNQRISFPNSVSYVGLGNLGKALSLKNE
tara:strand:- start:17129 stop:18517 length:1389 start_codon:yes stop_codon:yes gene_type:complete